MRSIEHSAADAVRAKLPANKSFHPLPTVKCDGTVLFRNQAARDVGCLLDVDQTVLSWQCQPLNHGGHPEQGTPDFLVVHIDGSQHFLDAPDRKPSETTFRERLPGEYRQLSHDEVYEGFRLQNARDLLQYGRWRTSLGDRVRLLTALDENGSLTLAECLGAIQETKPIAGIAALILSGLIEVDLDEALLGPETTVRRIRL
ncbi:hypothetical protein [Pararhizobium qamdonense]|uniref:hypothetical protein n=1 Tax=Pararhizobium qamdonense TaxID=3031126 RepID=UPI0023E10170|nr:hypothetical protein [Pararhizobium qamdonense]